MKQIPSMHQCGFRCDMRPPIKWLSKKRHRHNDNQKNRPMQREHSAKAFNQKMYMCGEIMCRYKFCAMARSQYKPTQHKEKIDTQISAINNNQAAVRCFRPSM